MGLIGGLESGGAAPQDLDLRAVELLAYFFTVTEMIENLHLTDLNAQQQTLLKAALLQEVAAQLAALPAVRTAVRDKVQAVSNTIRSHGAH
jgi:hypothetical protein